MLDGDVKIKVTGSGALSGDEEVTTESAGRLYTKNGSRYVLYEIPDENNPNIIVKHLLKISGPCVEITKSAGGLKNRIYYDPNAVTDSVYTTPYGVLNLRFKTLSVYREESAEEMRLELEYKILMEEDEISHNKLVIVIAVR